MRQPPYAILALVTVFASGCAAEVNRAPEVTLDERTGTTLSQLASPLQLLATEPGAPHGDPFAFAAPFETNRMGQRQMYLWVAVPGDADRAAALSLSLNGQALELPPAASEAGALGIATLPYAAPAPWSRVFVFGLDEAALRRLEAAQRIKLSVRYERGAPIEFAGAWDGNGVIAAFRRSLGLRD